MLRCSKVGWLLLTINVLLCVVLMIELTDTGSFPAVGFSEGNPFVKFAAYLQTQILAARLFILSLILTFRWEQFCTLFTATLPKENSITVLASCKEATLRWLVPLIALIGSRFITEIVTGYNTPAATAYFSAFKVYPRFAVFYYASFRLLGCLVLLGGNAAFAYVAQTKRAAGRKILDTAKSVIQRCHTDKSADQQRTDIWMLCRSYVVFTRQLMGKRNLFSVVLLIEVVGIILEFMSAASWLAMLAFSDSHANMQVIHRIATASWTIVIIPVQLSMIFYAAIDICDQSSETLDAFEKITFLCKCSAVGTDACSDHIHQRTLRILEMYNESKRLHGFSIGGFIEINKKVLSMILVYISGYATFAIDRMQNGSSANLPMKIQAASCRQAAAMRLNASHPL